MQCTYNVTCGVVPCVHIMFTPPWLYTQLCIQPPTISVISSTRNNELSVTFSNSTSSPCRINSISFVLHTYTSLSIQHSSHINTTMLRYKHLVTLTLPCRTAWHHQWQFTVTNNKTMYFTHHVKFPAYLCILTKSQFSKQILINVSNIKFCQNLSSESWDNICGRTDRQTWECQQVPQVICVKMPKKWMKNGKTEK